MFGGPDENRVGLCQKSPPGLGQGTLSAAAVGSSGVWAEAAGAAAGRCLLVFGSLTCEVSGLGFLTGRWMAGLMAETCRRACDTSPPAGRRFEGFALLVRCSHVTTLLDASGAP